MYAHGLYSAWPLWILWTLHTLVLIHGLGVLCYLVLDWDGQFHQLAPGYTTSLAFAFINFVAEPLEMVLWTYHLLEPLMYLIFQILKMILWLAVAGYGIYMLAAPIYVLPLWALGTEYTLAALTLLVFFASLVYAVVIFRRSNKRSGYEPPLLEKENMAARKAVERRHGKQPARMSQQALARPISSVYSDFEGR